MARTIAAALLAASLFAPGKPQDCAVNVPLSGWIGNTAPLINGYCVDGYAVPGLITNSFYWTQPPDYFVTRALHQAPQLMEETGSMHGFTLNGLDGFVALMSPSTDGWIFYIRREGQSEWLRVQDVEPVKPEHEFYHVYWERSGIELSYALAESMDAVDWINADGTRYPNVEVCIRSTPQECSALQLVDYRDWFLSHVTYQPHG